MSSDSFKTILRADTGFRFKGQQGFYLAKQSWSRSSPARHHHLYLCSRIFCKTISEVWNPFPRDEFLLPPGPQSSPFFLYEFLGKFQFLGSPCLNSPIVKGKDPRDYLRYLPFCQDGYDNVTVSVNSAQA